MQGDCVVVRKGAWTQQEDVLLRNCVEANGEGNWHQVPGKAGLNRCRKSCRLRWLNYLKPNLKRGKFEEDEVDLLVKLHNLLGNRWSMIAKRLPGRTGNDVKNYWNTHLANKFTSSSSSTKHSKPAASNNKLVRVHHHHQVIRPKARTVKNVVVWQPSIMKPTISSSSPAAIPDNEISSWQWWETLLADNHNVNDPAIGGEYSCAVSHENTNIAKGGGSSSSSFNEDSLWIMLSEEEDRINQSIWETLGIDDMEM